MESDGMNELIKTNKKEARAQDNIVNRNPKVVITKHLSEGCN